MNKKVDTENLDEKIGKEKEVNKKSVDAKIATKKKDGENSIFKKMTYNQKSRFLGEIVGLALRSELYSQYTLKEIFRTLLQPINKNQFRIYRIKDRTIGIVTWAYLSDDKQDKYLSGKEEIKPDEWTSGNNLVITDFLAPFGHAKEIFKDLQINIFPNRIAKAKKVVKKGKIKSVQKFYGKNAKKTSRTLDEQKSKK